MEFIPLENYKKKLRKTERKVNETKPKKFKQHDTVEEKNLQKRKKNPQTKAVKKNEVKSNNDESVVKRKIFEKAKNKAKMEIHKNKREENVEDKVENIQVKSSQKKNEEDEKSSESEDANEEKALKNKCKEMDEKKKNRLFIKLKKKILSEAQIKELHPGIRSVIFPRKKNTRWCWAVFASEEKAAKAMKKLIKNKDVLVNKPTPYENVELKRREKVKAILRKKQARKKLQEMWLL